MVTHYYYSSIILLIGAYVSLNNKLVVLDQNATARWQMLLHQRRADLIPNIVSTAKDILNLNNQH